MSSSLCAKRCEQRSGHLEKPDLWQSCTFQYERFTLRGFSLSFTFRPCECSAVGTGLPIESGVGALL